jgi:hypothetical protein
MGDYFIPLRNVQITRTFQDCRTVDSACRRIDFRGAVMKRILSMAILALAISGSAALAQTTNPGVSTAPSAPNSGAGVAGQPGNKNGPAAKPGGTVGSGVGAQNPSDQTQDTSNIKGLPGNKSGPPAKQSDRK